MIAPFLTSVLLVATVSVGVSAAEPAESPAASPSSTPAERAAAESELAEATDERPDIIVVMVDDLAYIPDDRILKRLPNIRELWLRGGARFTQAFNEIPLCCPARANFHSAQHSLRNGVVVNDWEGFDSSETLVTAIDGAGYHTIFAGKYLNGYPGEDVPPGWDRAMLTAEKSSRTRNPSFWIDGELLKFQDRFFDDVVREKGVRWLKQAPLDAPAFEVVAPFAPHRFSGDCKGFVLPCLMSPIVMKRDRGAEECADIRNFKPPSYSTTPDFKAAAFRVPERWKDGWPLVASCESLLVVDRMVGQLVKAQEERGRPAYFVFLSDNGMAWGQHGHPLKHVPWASRLPLYFAGPGIEKSKVPSMLSIIDVPVTLAAMAGTTMPAADGVSFLGELDGEASAGHDTILELMPAPPPEDAGAYEGWSAIRTGRWRYIRWDRGVRELYDVRTDPWETNNKIARKPRLVKRLDKRLDALIESSRG